MNLVLALVLNALALVITANINIGIHVADFTTALVAAIILGVINTFIKPILTIITLPLTILTLGLFAFVVNAIVLWMVTLFVPGLRIDSMMSTIVGAIVLSVVSTVLSSLVKDLTKGRA